MIKEIYKIIIYTFIRGLIHKGYTSYNLIQLKRELDKGNSMLYKILSIVI